VTVLLALGMLRKAPLSVFGHANVPLTHHVSMVGTPYPVNAVWCHLASSATIRAVSALIVSACVSFIALSSCIDFINAYCKSVW